MGGWWWLSTVPARNPLAVAAAVWATWASWQPPMGCAGLVGGHPVGGGPEMTAAVVAAAAGEVVAAVGAGAGGEARRVDAAGVGGVAA